MTDRGRDSFAEALQRARERHDNAVGRRGAVSNLARACGVDRGTVHRWLNGEYLPRKHHFLNILQFFGDPGRSGKVAASEVARVMWLIFTEGGRTSDLTSLSVESYLTRDQAALLTAWVFEDLHRESGLMPKLGTHAGLTELASRR